MAISRSAYRYEPDTGRDQPIIDALCELAEKNPAYGFQLMFDRLHSQGHRWNHKRVYRVYKVLKLNLRRKYKRRLPSRHPQPLTIPEQLNQSGSMDFMHDALTCGRRFRTFNVIDDYNREAAKRWPFRLI